MKEILAKLLNHEELSREEMKNILVGITHSEYPNEQITALLTALQMRGVSVDELLGFRDGILETGVPVPLDCDRYIDVVGTGGDRKNTFNISTTSCFVIAGAGYKVAKHGNYAATSTSGASNVIAQHGVKFTDDLNQLNRCLDECGIVYLHAQLFAKAMKFVGPIRKALPFPTIFNLLGPLVNPSQPSCQLLGVANLDQMRLYHQVYQRLGIDYGIVNSIDGYDEISLTGDFKVTVGIGSTTVPAGATVPAVFTAGSSYERISLALLLPNQKSWLQVLPRPRQRKYSTVYWKIVLCLPRRISSWPTQPSVFKYWRRERRASKSASTSLARALIAVLPCAHSRNS